MHEAPLICRDFISTPFPDVAEEGDLDVIIMDFALEDFSESLYEHYRLARRALSKVAAVNTLDPSRELTAGELEVYAPGTVLNKIWGDYAKMAWQP